MRSKGKKVEAGKTNSTGSSNRNLLPLVLFLLYFFEGLILKRINKIVMGGWVPNVWNVNEPRRGRPKCSLCFRDINHSWNHPGYGRKWINTLSGCICLFVTKFVGELTSGKRIFLLHKKLFLLILVKKKINKHVEKQILRVFARIKNIRLYFCVFWHHITSHHPPQKTQKTNNFILSFPFSLSLIWL